MQPHCKLKKKKEKNEWTTTLSASVQNTWGQRFAVPLCKGSSTCSQIRNDSYLFIYFSLFQKSIMVSRCIEAIRAPLAERSNSPLWWTGHSHGVFILKLSGISLWKAVITARWQLSESRHAHHCGLNNTFIPFLYDSPFDQIWSSVVYSVFFCNLQPTHHPAPSQKNPISF